jgi:hypothetical protein
LDDKILSLFVKNVSISDEKKMSELGRMICLCESLNIHSFSNFSIFSDVYVMQKTMSKKSSNSFGTGLDFKERFSLIFNDRTLFKKFNILKNNRLIIWHSKNKYKIPIPLMNSLEPNSTDFYNNVDWQKEIARVLEEKQFSNSNDIERLSKLGN